MHNSTCPGFRRTFLKNDLFQCKLLSSGFPTKNERVQSVYLLERNYPYLGGLRIKRILSALETGFSNIFEV
jgi:hypothetical protein